MALTVAVGDVGDEEDVGQDPGTTGPLEVVMVEGGEGEEEEEEDRVIVADLRTEGTGMVDTVEEVSLGGNHSPSTCNDRNKRNASFL